MPTYKVTLNWHGEIHTLWTTTTGTIQAIRNAKYQLANKLGKDLSYVRRHFWTGDKVKVEKED